MNPVARIARRGERITFQHNEIYSDQYRNHLQRWTDYFTCYAYASTFAKDESGNEVILEERSITFECRFCPELSIVTSTGYRIIFHDEQYDIKSIDMMNYQKQTIKFVCQRHNRQERES